MPASSQPQWDAPGKTILTLFMVPIFITCLLCVITFTVLHNLHTKALTTAANQFVNEYFKYHIAALSHPQSIQTWFNEHTSILLYTGQYEHFALLDEQGNLLAQSGLPQNHDHTEWFSPTVEIMQHHNHTHISSHYKAADGTGFWVITTINNAYQTVLFLKTLLWGLSCTFVTALVLAWLAIRCHKQLIEPLHTLTHELKQACNGNTEVELSQPKNPIYTLLVKSARQLLAIHRDLQESTQHHIEQATHELRESLETVEIQNIELDFARKKALQASADKSELLAATSHEIRTPLNGILGFTHLLLKTELSDQQQDYLATIEQSAQGLLTVINDIIDYSRLESGSMSFEYKPVNIRETITEILQVYAPSANENHLRLIQWIDPNIPSNLLGDPLRLKQVLNNLIHCVIGIESSGDLIIESAIINESDSKIRLQFVIINPSAHISNKQKAQLQAALSNPSHIQIGHAASIGLTIAKTLAERMRGQIEALFGNDSIAFTFTIELGLPEIPTGNTVLIAQQNVRALVCDANPNSQKELILDLRYWNIHPATESNPERLIPRILQTKTNVVFIDCITQGQGFNKAHLLKQLEQLQQLEHLHIAVIAPSNIRRQIEADITSSNVYFILRPIVRASISQALQRVSGIPQHSPTIEPKSQIHILVADDNPANSKLVCAFLQQDNHIITTAENGQQALDAFITHKPDIIFMDVQMPEMDGLQATMAIRKIEAPDQRVPIVALTANALTEQRARILMAGIDDYLTKPVSDTDLQHALKRWVKAAKAEQPISPPPPIKLTPLNEKKIPSPIQPTFSLHESLCLTKGNAELARDMLSALIEELPDFKVSINAAIHEANTTALSDAIHKLNGGAAYCGLIKLKAAANHADKITHEGELLHAAGQLLHCIEEAIVFCSELDIDSLFDE